MGNTPGARTKEDVRRPSPGDHPREEDAARERSHQRDPPSSTPTALGMGPQSSPLMEESDRHPRHHHRTEAHQHQRHDPSERSKKQKKGEAERRRQETGPSEREARAAGKPGAAQATGSKAARHDRAREPPPHENGPGAAKPSKKRNKEKLRSVGETAEDCRKRKKTRGSTEQDDERRAKEGKSAREEPAPAAQQRNRRRSLHIESGASLRGALVSSSVLPTHHHSLHTTNRRQSSERRLKRHSISIVPSKGRDRTTETSNWLTAACVEHRQSESIAREWSGSSSKRRSGGLTRPIEGLDAIANSTTSSTRGTGTAPSDQEQAASTSTRRTAPHRRSDHLSDRRDKRSSGGQPEDRKRGRTRSSGGSAIITADIGIAGSPKDGRSKDPERERMHDSGGKEERRKERRGRSSGSAIIRQRHQRPSPVMTTGSAIVGRPSSTGGSPIGVSAMLLKDQREKKEKRERATTGGTARSSLPKSPRPVDQSSRCVSLRGNLIVGEGPPRSFLAPSSETECWRLWRSRRHPPSKRWSAWGDPSPVRTRSLVCGCAIPVARIPLRRRKTVSTSTPEVHPRSPSDSLMRSEQQCHTSVRVPLHGARFG